MDAITQELSVAKKSPGHGGKREGAGRPKSERDDVVVKFDRTLVEIARIIAAIERAPIAEVLSESARSTLYKRYERALKTAPPPKHPPKDSTQ